ncbi:MAG: tetratricopeptide repeat protein [Candidatus Omnitrophota bacterium]|nr:tetratricopeptide repeat protein [Candidatus Omnitrophota bacterium]
MKNILILSAILILISAAAAVYAPALNTPFQFDDVKRIVGQAQVENLDLADIFHYSKSRFLLYLTLALNYHFGGYGVFGFHLVNLVIHIISSLAVFALGIIVFNSPRLKNQALSRHSRMLAFFSSMIFALHPMQTESVTYIWQRAESMTGMFYLLAIFLYAKFRLASAARPRFMFYAACLLSIILCSFTKPNSVTLPAAILLFEACFLSRSIKDFKGSLKYLAPILLFILLPAALAKFDVGENKGVSVRFDSYYLPYYYTKLRVLANSLWLMFAPFNQTIEHDFSWSASLVNPISTLYSAAALLSLALAGILSFRRRVLIAFSVMWFYLTLSVTTILFLDDLFFEHYLYLPIFGFSLVLPALGMEIADNFKLDKKWLAACLIILLAAYSYGTYSRNLVWKTEITLWEDAVKKAPLNARAHYTLGVYYFREHRNNEALREYELSLKLKPEYPEAYYRLGEYYFDSGAIDKSIYNYKKALDMNPDFFEAYVNLGNAYMGSGQNKDALACFKNALRLTVDKRYITEINSIIDRLVKYE